MNLRTVDLNLLVVLNALLTERHVTRAADKVGLSQPAMSNALSRLRHIFGDELLVRTNTGMQPTSRALELAEPLAQTLRQIERVLESEHVFDPATSSQLFTVRLSDLLGLLLLPPLFARLGKEAPDVKLNVVHISPLDTVEALEQDKIDFAVSMDLTHTSSIISQPLMTDRMVCVMRKGHPFENGPRSMDAFLSERHLKVSMSPTDFRFVDDVLARQKLERSIALNVPHWLLIPDILEKSDLVSVMPERFATALNRSSLAIRELPFATGSFEWSMYWHRRHDGNRAMRWMRKVFAQIAENSKSNVVPKGEDGPVS